jgi:cellulose synthase/poly-beta-1,6-N-acetylglucosamine synthase-like glycosyltransferase
MQLQMTTQVLNYVWVFLQVIIGYNLIFPAILLLIYSIRKKDKVTKAALQTSMPDYAIIVTAYEQTNTVPAVVASILKLNYTNYLVYIVADKCDVSNLVFADERVKILRPEETLGSNTRSHFYAINRFIRPHTHLTIIDSDNLVEPEYLNQLNIYFNQGYQAVQGVREAKNLDTTLSCLDAARDIYYHYYDGKVLFGAGSSATLAGSGMAFTTQLYRDSLEHLDVTGAGFDKVLQSAIVGKNLRIAFASGAIVYDEKTSHSDQLVNQRARWINTWFKYFKFGFGMVGKGIRNFSGNQFLFGVVLLRPPLFMFLILSVLFMAVNLWVSLLAVAIWAIGFVLFVFGFYLALALNHTDQKIYNSLINIPKFIFYQFLSLLNARQANKRSVATKHYHHVELTDLNEKK